MMSGRRGPSYPQRYSPYGSGNSRYGRYDDYNDYYDGHNDHRGYGGQQHRSPQHYQRPSQQQQSRPQPTVKAESSPVKKDSPKPTPQQQTRQVKSEPSLTATPTSASSPSQKQSAKVAPKPVQQQQQKLPVQQQASAQEQKPPAQQEQQKMPVQSQKPPVQQQQRLPNQQQQRAPAQGQQKSLVQQKSPAQQEQRPSAQQEQRHPAQQEQRPPAQQEQRPPAQQEQRPPAQQEQRPPAQQEQRPPAQQEQRPPAQQQQRPPTQQQQRPPTQQQQRPPTQQQQRPPTQQQQRPPVQQQQGPPAQPQHRPPVQQQQRQQQSTAQGLARANQVPKQQEATKEDPENADNCKLFVANAPSGMTDDEFRKMFAEHGEVREVFLNKIKWFGFVTFRTHQQADKAMRALDGAEKNGRRLRVRYAQVQREREEKPAPVMVPPVPQIAPPKKHGARCRLFVGNLPVGLLEADFRNMFEQYGELVEVYLHPQKGFGFIKYDQRSQAEAAKAALDNTPVEGRYLQIRFATQGSSLIVKHLSPWVSNELLEEAFSIFGEIDRAVVIVDDRGRSVGEGIVEFARKTSALMALKRASQGCLLLTSSPRPVLVEPLDLRDEEDGFPEKNVNKNNPQYLKEREIGPRFAEPGTFEYEFSSRWKKLLELEKQKRDFLERELEDERHKLEEEMEYYRYEHELRLIREQLHLMEEQGKVFLHEREARLTEQKRRAETRRQEEMILRKREEEILGLSHVGMADQQQQQLQMQPPPVTAGDAARGVPPVPPTEGATFVSTYDNGRAEFSSHSPRQSRFDQPYTGPPEDGRSGPRTGDQDDYNRDIKRRRY